MKRTRSIIKKRNPAIVILVTVSLLASFVPMYAAILFHSSTSSEFQELTWSLAFWSSWSNPFIYLAVNPSFRQFTVRQAHYWYDQSRVGQAFNLKSEVCSNSLSNRITGDMELNTCTTDVRIAQNLPVLTNALNSTTADTPIRGSALASCTVNSNTDWRGLKIVNIERCCRYDTHQRYFVIRYSWLSAIVHWFYLLSTAQKLYISITAYWNHDEFNSYFQRVLD